MRKTDPYSYFSEEIALDEANDLPKEFYGLLEKWKNQVMTKYHDKTISWYSKNVSTTFEYNKKTYRLIAEDFYQEEMIDKAKKGDLHIGYFHAVVESLQSEIEKDLIRIGASNIKSIGFLD